MTRTAQRLLTTLLLALPIAAFAAAPITPQVVDKTGPPAAMTHEGDFSEYAVRNGVTATQQQCEQVASTVWTSTAAGDQACLKYWAEGFGNAGSQRAIVFFWGDVWEGRLVAGYPQMSNRVLANSAREWAGKLGVPYVMIARPGTFGSSGDHMQRRRPAESLLISAALDALKDRLGITEFVAVGYSGGGHVVASLLTLRSDIVCAVPTAAVASPRLRWTLRNWTTDSTGYGDSYEPTEHLDKQRLHPQLRVFVVGDPFDRNGVWPAQTILAEKLVSLDIAAHVVEGQGTGPQRHGGLGGLSRRIAGWCASGLPTEEILRRATQSD